MTHATHRLPLYRTDDHPCAYLPGRLARTVFVDPTATIDSASYQTLLERGFRRSGSHVYRPDCRRCAACVPLRIPVATFQPNRSQRRTWQRNRSDITCTVTAATFHPKHFALYCRYLRARHPDGNMADEATADSYRQFLLDDWGGDTRLLEFHCDQELVGVAVTDLLPHGWSAVYTFFEPTLAPRALGVVAVLTQIHLLQLLQLPYLYLGYWIQETRKMAYKTNYRPCEMWTGDHWRVLE
ncbi:arginyltransferase [Chromatium okenii]|uniref:arginyltransferase n=1 Tax=Chromatium okenii TaxID=61644 RepID=UPI001904CFFE|nr:arginyltransferase [Chromatium okenii]MBK1642548.1 arginyltransferase [Chromatium okenii]